MYHLIYQMRQKKKLQKLQKRKRLVVQGLRSFFWFVTGAVFTTFLLTSFAFLIFKNINSNVVFPGIIVANVDLGKKTKVEVEELFAKKNEAIASTEFTFLLDSMAATISARNLELGYDQSLIANQALSLGRSDNFFSNISIVFQAYFGGLNLQPAYHYSEEKFNEILNPFIKKVNKEPVDALFNFLNGKVITFKWQNILQFHID